MSDNENTVEMEAPPPLPNDGTSPPMGDMGAPPPPPMPMGPGGAMMGDMGAPPPLPLPMGPGGAMMGDMGAPPPPPLPMGPGAPNPFGMDMPFLPLPEVSPVGPGNMKLNSVKNSIPTGEMLTAALGRLNRQSVTALLGQLADAINECADENSVEKQTNLINNIIASYNYVPTLNSWMTGYDFSAHDNLQSTIDTRIAGYNFATNAGLSQQIEQTIDQHDYSSNSSIGSLVETSATNVKTLFNNTTALLKGSVVNLAAKQLEQSTAISELQSALGANATKIKDINDAIQNISEINTLKLRISKLTTDLKHALTLAGNLDQFELEQVRQLIMEILDNPIFVSKVMKNLYVTVNERSLTLNEVINALITAHHVESVDIDYADVGDVNLIRGCRYLLTDGTKVDFTAHRVEEPSGNVTFVFMTQNWKGLTASFKMQFARRQSPSYKVFKRNVSLEWHEPVHSSNLLFSLFN